MSRIWVDPEGDDRPGLRIVSSVPVADRKSRDYKSSVQITTSEGTMSTHATTIVRKRRRDFDEVFTRMVREGWIQATGTSRHRFRHHEVTLTYTERT